jgi:hypothetical protein
MHIWTLKLVMSTMLEDTVRVRVAAVDCPGKSFVPSLDQLESLKK